ncbi:MAG TPA: hypothetical protein DCX21_02450 [Eubacterium sp.]|nr:hypothetical protein [Eubacterium sp.]
MTGMKRYNKGELNYLKDRRIKQGAFLVLYMIMIVLIVLWGIYKSGDKNNIWTVFAILCCIPFSKFATEYILLLRKKSIDSKRVESYAGYNDNLLYNMVLSTQAGMIYADFVFYDDSHMVLLCDRKLKDEPKIKNCVEDFMKKGGVTVNPGVCYDDKEFAKVIAGFSISNGKRMKRMKELLDILHV